MKRPLSNIETALTYTESVYPMSIVNVLQLQNAPALSVLTDALAQIQTQQPLLRAQILQKNGRFSFQLLQNPTPIPVTQIQRKDDTQWQTIATEQLNSQFDLTKPPYMRCTYLLDEATKTADLIFTFHHSIADASSLIHLYDQLLHLCATPNQEALPSLTMLSGVDDHFPTQWQGAAGVGKLAKFMGRQMGDELRYRRGLGKAPKQPFHPSGQCQILLRQLDEASTNKLNQLSRQQKITPNTIVSTAMLLAVHTHVYDGAATMLRAITFADLRSYLHPPLTNETLGCYISMMRHTVQVTSPPDFWQVAADLQDDIYQTTKRGDKFLFSKMSNPLTKLMIRLQKMRMSTTAISYGGVITLKPHYGDITLTDLHGFISNNPTGPDYSAFAKIINGRLSLDILYLNSDMDSPTANQIADSCVNWLQQLQ